MKKVLSLALALVMIFTMLPLAAIAAGVDFDLGNAGCDYYNLISKKDYPLAPGAVESEIVINDDTGANRNVIHVVTADPKNPDIAIMPAFKNMGKDTDYTNTDNWGAQTVMQQAADVEANLGLNVIAGCNVNLRYDSYAPMGVMVWDGVVMGTEWNKGNNYLMVYKDGSTAIVPRFASQAEFEAYDWSNVQCCVTAFQWLVKDGKNVSADSHANSARHPRTVLGLKADGTIVMMQVEGRISTSVGMTDCEMAETMLSLGCKYAINCDGGGSSTFVTEREGTGELTMKNVPSDGSPRATLVGLLVVSTAEPTGTFHHANIVSEYDYFAPNSTYNFTVMGVDSAGGPVAEENIPALTWKLSDPTFGTVNGSAITFNGGKTGAVTVEIYNGEALVGSRVIHVENPEAVAFDAAEKVVPYGKAIQLAVVATKGINNVYYDESTFELKLSNAAAATLNGFEILATEDESITGVTVTGSYRPVPGLLNDIKVNISFGKGSEVIWNFEDAADGSNNTEDIWNGVDEMTKWAADNGSKDPVAGFYNATQNETSTVFLADAQTGAVKNGEHSLGITLDFTQSKDFANWQYNYFFYTGENQVWRDTANGKNATRIGMWVYVPEETEALTMQLCFTAKTGAGALNGNRKTLKMVNANGVVKNFSGITAADIPESRWVYCYYDLTASTYASTLVQGAELMGGGEEKNDVYPAFVRFYTQSEIAKEVTFYIDDITIDYSDVTEDRDEPFITAPSYSLNADHAAEIKGQTVTTGTFGLLANIAEDTSKANFTGLDYNTAKIFVDGVDFSKKAGFSVSETTISLAEVNLVDGLHSIGFEIADKQGNYTRVTRQIKVAANTGNPTVTVSGRNDSNDTPKMGSTYYLDVKTANASLIESISMQLDLNTCNTFALDGITAGEGFRVSYELDERINVLTLNITSEGTATVQTRNAGEATLATIPVHVWSWEGRRGVSADAQWKTGKSPIIEIKYSAPSVLVDFADGVVGSEYVTSFVQSETVVATELYAKSNTIMANDPNAYWHVHDTELTITNLDPTCTESGFENRAYCASCQSTIDYGTILPATGHTYAVADGKLTCHCGDTIMETGLIEMNGNLYYAINGALKTGWITDGENFYYFDTVTFAAVDGEQTIGGYNYLFENNILVRGELVQTNKGLRIMWAGSFATAGWFTMQGDTYAISMHGIVYTGISMVQFSNEAPTVYEFTEEGVLVRKFGTGLFIHNGKTYYLTDGTVTKGLVLAEDGYYYYFSTSQNYAAITGRYYITYDNGLGITGFQEFDEQGRMIIHTDGIREIDGVLYYIENGAKCGKGLVKIGEDFYYARSNGQLAIGKYYISNDNGLGYTGWQFFGEDGKMVIEDEGEVKDGFITEDGKLYYYVNGEMLSNGLFEVDGNYYYARSSGQLAVGRYYVTNNNGYEYTGWQEFGTDGKMVIEGTENPGEVKDGFITEDGKLYYYVNGEMLSNGLFMVDGNYYYARSSGQLAVGRYYVTNSNGLPYEGWQEFDTDGKLIIQ